MGLNTHSNPVLRFAYGYRDIITRDNARLNTMLPDARRWVVDLSAAGLWSHLNHWGRTGKLLSVRCDESKPLKSIAGEFTGGDDDPGIRQARQKHNPEPLGWKLLEPITLVDSRDHPAVHLADVIASAVHTRSSRKAFLGAMQLPKASAGTATPIPSCRTWM